MKYTLKKYLAFSTEEIRSLLITILVIGFIFSFKEWGVDQFDLLYGLKNFVNVSLIVGLAFLVHEVVQKYVSLRIGLMAEYKAWTFGLILGLILIFLSRGDLIFLAPGGILIHHLAGARLGRFRYGLNHITMGWIAVTGPLANIVLAIFFKLMLLFPFFNPVLIQKAIFINVWLAVFSMLPIPPLDGSKMFFASRFLYVMLFGFFVAVAFLLYYYSITIAIIGSILVGLLTLVLYWVSFESPV